MVAQLQPEQTKRTEQQTFATPWWQTVLIVLLLLIVVGVVAFALYRLGLAVAGVQSETGRAILLAGFVAATTIVINIVTSVQTAKAQRSQVITQAKRRLYIRFLRTIFRFMKMTDVSKEQQDTETAEMVSELRKMTPELLVWASPGVVQAWNSWRVHLVTPYAEEDATEHAKNALLLMAELINQIRQELGLSRMNPKDSLGFFINDIAEFL